MKKLMLIATLLASTAAMPQCTTRPLKPLIPLGCKDIRAICQCDENGQNCQWVWVCVPE